MRRILTGTMAVNYPISLILKGVSSEITTKEILASKLSISAVRIRRFDWYSDRIEASIKGNYILQATAFKGNTSLTDLLDVGGNISNIAQNGLSGCTSLVNVKFDNAYIGNGSLSGLSNITNILYSGTFKARVLNVSALASTSFKKVIIDSGSITSGSMRDMPNLEEVYLPGLTSVDTDGFNGSAKLSILNTSDITNIGNRSFIGTAFVNLDFPKLVSVGNVTSFANISTLKTIKLGSLVNISSSESFFTNCPLLEYIDMKKVKTYGTYNNTAGASTKYGFNNVKLGCIIDCNIALATANTTNNTAHEALKWVKENRQAVVRFYDDNGNYVSTL